jgi:hypothetical protein
VTKIKNIIFIFLFIFLLSACSTSTASNSTDAQSEESNPYGGFSIPPPTNDEIILTVIGDSTVNFSLDDLRALPKVSITIQEPFILEERTFEGVYLAEIFKIAGIGSDQLVDTIALNEYRYQDQAKNFEEAEAILAYSVDTAAIDMDKGGPIRLVFDQNSNYFNFLDAWNWSLQEISVSKE